jgi:hypothetical protein
MRAESFRLPDRWCKSTTTPASSSAQQPDDVHAQHENSAGGRVIGDAATFGTVDYNAFYCPTTVRTTITTSPA